MTLADLDLKPNQESWLKAAHAGRYVYLTEDDPDVQELVAMNLLRTYPYYQAGKRCFALTLDAIALLTKADLDAGHAGHAAQSSIVNRQSSVPDPRLTPIF